nr:putative L-type lectin-domain containing receptor kinase S.5 [Fagopyrum tataricum]
MEMNLVHMHTMFMKFLESFLVVSCKIHLLPPILFPYRYQN